jgi:hypothetical protein
MVNLIGVLQVAIEISKYGDRYQVAVSPPEGSFWRSAGALSATDVLAKLSALGCHSTDITDALTSADPTWKLRHDAEVLLKRNEQESKDNDN